jgi:hypothetical protein
MHLQVKELTHHCLRMAPMSEDLSLSSSAEAPVSI